MAVNRFTLQQIYSNLVLPPLPPYPVNSPIAAEAYSMSDTELLNVITTAGSIENQFFPLQMKLDSDAEYWTLPQEPLISLSGKNVVIRRNVSKANYSVTDVRGTVKERWAQDDYSINITGVLRNFKNENEYPHDDVMRLRGFCESKKVIEVLCPLFEIFGITQIVIEDYDIPFTPGEDLQAFTIKAYSDFLFELLIDVE